MTRPCSTAPDSHRRRVLSPQRAAWLVGILVAAGFGARSPGTAWAKAAGSAKKTPAAESAAAPPNPNLTPPTQPGPEAPAGDPAPEPSAVTPAAPAVPTSGGPQYGAPAAGIGSVTVKGDGMQITFDGRPFGVAPVTIHNVPRGDYVVEGTAPDGTHVSRAVYVEDNAEAIVELRTNAIGTPAAAPRLDDGRSGRFPLASKILLGVSAGGLATGMVFGLLAWKTHNDYERAPADQATLDALARTGRRDAMLANIGLVTCGVSLVAAAAIVLPRLLKADHPAPEATKVAITASTTRGSVIAGLSMRF